MGWTVFSERQLCLSGSIGALACLEVKMIGKPYAGELHVRFDEGEQDFVLRKILNGHEAGNGGYSQGAS